MCCGIASQEKPGASQTVDIAINRNGFEGSLALTVEKAPEKVTATVANLDAKQNSVKLQVAAAGDAPDAAQPVVITANVAGQPISVEVPVQIPSTEPQYLLFNSANHYWMAIDEPGEVPTSSHLNPIETGARTRPADTVGEAGEIIQPLGHAGLAAQPAFLDHQHVEPLAGRVQRGSQAGRPAADDD